MLEIRRNSALLPIALAGLFLGAACGKGSGVTGADAPDRETFITTYVDLRETALKSGMPITAEQRTAVLAQHGMTEADLMSFVDAHGREVDYMVALWDEIGSRIEKDATPAVTP